MDKLIRYYNIHNLVNILVYDVNVELVSELDFKYEYFSCEKENASLLEINSHKIKIFPYDSLSIKGGSCISHKTVYSVGKFAVEKDKEIGIYIIGNEYHIYTNGLNIIDIIVQLVLIKNNHSFMHAACYKKNNKGYAITGLGGIGKTQIIMKSLQEPNVSILGDDLVIVSKEGVIKSFPKPFMLKRQHKEVAGSRLRFFEFRRKTLSVYSGVFYFMKDNIPFSGLIKKLLFADNALLRFIKLRLLPKDAELVAMSPVNININIEDISKHNNIILVDRIDASSSTIELNINKNEAVNRLVGIINAEFHTTIWVLLFLSKFNLVNLEYFNNNSYEVYRGFLEKNKFSHIESGILIDPTSYCEMIVNKLEID